MNELYEKINKIISMQTAKKLFVSTLKFKHAVHIAVPQRLI